MAKMKGLASFVNLVNSQPQANQTQVQYASQLQQQAALKQYQQSVNQIGQWSTAMSSSVLTVGLGNGLGQSSTPSGDIAHWVQESVNRYGTADLRWIANASRANPSDIHDWLLSNGFKDDPRYGSYIYTADQGKKKVVTKKKVTYQKVTMDSVILAEEKKEQILSAISQQKHQKIIFQKWGFEKVFEKGTAVSLLFWGIPGTGKTLMAQAIADLLEYELKIYGTAEIESMEPGGAERMIKQIFAEAKRNNKKAVPGEETVNDLDYSMVERTEEPEDKPLPKPRIICLDECDSLLMDRNEVGPVIGAQINTLLQEIEKFDGILIFTTNRLGKLDPALERRITTKVEFTFPDKVARLAIWQRMIPKKAPLAEDVNLEQLAKFEIAGGNIKNAVLNAARTAAYKKEKVISMPYFKQAVEIEIKSLEAFREQYEDVPHHPMMGYSRGQGGLTVGKQKKTEFISSINIK